MGFVGLVCRDMGHLQGVGETSVAARGGLAWGAKRESPLKKRQGSTSPASPLQMPPRPMLCSHLPRPVGGQGRDVT